MTTHHEYGRVDWLRRLGYCQHPRRQCYICLARITHPGQHVRRIHPELIAHPANERIVP